jgi:hypothetical protein
LETKLAADRRVIKQQAMSSTAELFASAVFLTRMKLRHLTAQKNDWEKESVSMPALEEEIPATALQVSGQDFSFCRVLFV